MKKLGIRIKTTLRICDHLKKMWIKQVLSACDWASDWARHICPNPAQVQKFCKLYLKHSHFHFHTIEHRSSSVHNIEHHC